MPRSARNTASASPISAWTPTPQARAPASSSRRSCPSAPTLHLSFPSLAKTSPRSRSTTSSSASKGLSTATPIPSRFAQDCPRRSTKACSRTPTSPSMCATGARRSGLPARPMCCRKTGQQGIPLISVNTDALKVTIYRIGDRSLLDNVLGYDFERNLYELFARRHRQPEGREGMDRRAQGREGAQPGDHHRLPHQRGGAGHAARRLSARRAARQCSRR